LDFRNCLFAGNYSKSHGGGLYVIDSGPVITECTIVGNRAEEHGGGIKGGAWADIELNNSIIRENTARLDGDQISLAYEPGEDPDGRRILARYCAYEGGSWSPTNIKVDPLHADPGYWDDNGTPDDWSDDTWIDGDYHLKSYAGRWEPVGENWVTDNVHSPCIDAGDPAGAFSAEPAYNGGRINIGAYGGTEYASKTPNCPEHPIGDLDGDCRVTLADLAMLAGSWQDCNLDPPIACE
jgi:predicted outer membrane repeat protein